MPPAKAAIYAGRGWGDIDNRGQMSESFADLDLLLSGGSLGQHAAARAALLDAFAELALTRRYHDFGVGLIARRANVARSTFYYHFRSKDELLVGNLAPMFAALSQLVLAQGPTPEVEVWTAHIWEHRTRAARMFEGALRRRITEALTLALRSVLEEAVLDPPDRRLAPLIADQVAGGMLGLLQSWTSGRSAATPAEVCRLLWSSAQVASRAVGVPAT